jgi:predicted ATP-grasp superfamily ATP-dependent carboligase
MRILVTDGEQRSSLAVVRSLGRAGHKVIVSSVSGSSLSGASRFAAQELALPDPLSEPLLFGEELVGLLASQDVDVLIPMTEASLRVALPLRSRFGNVIVPFPAIEVFERASDKAGLTEEARAVGVAVPGQVVLTSHDCSPIDLVDLRFPLVLKPTTSIYQEGGRQRKTSVLHVSSRSELTESLRELPGPAFPVLAQRRIEGPGIGIFLLRWDGTTRAVFAHRRIREKPPSGGVSVFRESIEPAKEWVEQAEDLLEALDWEGVAMVEFKQDSSTGQLVLMEVNGRFWGSLQLAIDSGVDFPRLLLDCATGSLPGQIQSGRSGIRLRWELGEVDYLLARLRRSDEELHLPPNEPSRTRAVLSIIRPWIPGERWEVLRPSDPKPFLRELALWIRGR